MVSELAERIVGLLASVPWYESTENMAEALHADVVEVVGALLELGERGTVGYQPMRGYYLVGQAIWG